MLESPVDVATLPVLVKSKQRLLTEKLTKIDAYWR